MGVDRSAVYFRVQGTGLLDEVSDCLQIRPSWGWDKGELVDPVADKSKKRAFMRWALNSPVGPDMDTATQLSALLDILRPISERILLLDSRFSPEVVISYSGSRGFGFRFGRVELEEIVKLQLGVDIDFYCLRSAD